LFWRVYPSRQQLPPPPPDFTGRETELAELEAAITEKNVPICGLWGKDGTGKTSLTLKLAERLKQQYGDAQLYLDMHSMNVEQAMGHVLCAYRPGRELLDGESARRGLYQRELKDQKVLLVVDNPADYQQVMALQGPRSCVLVVTSEEPLPGLYGLELDALPLDDARIFLITKAPRTAECADELARLCGCLPLALRLAGSALTRRKNLSPQMYLESLEKARNQQEPVAATLSLAMGY
jgi:hypothetical protein